MHGRGPTVSTPLYMHVVVAAAALHAAAAAAGAAAGLLPVAAVAGCKHYSPLKVPFTAAASDAPRMQR